MRINVKEKSRRLETISVGDVLVFNGREETVDEVDTLTGKLFTKRKLKSKNLIGEEFVSYNNIEKIYPKSEGEVYNWKKRVA